MVVTGSEFLWLLISTKISNYCYQRKLLKLHMQQLTDGQVQLLVHNSFPFLYSIESGHSLSVFVPDQHICWKTKPNS